MNNISVAELKANNFKFGELLHKMDQLEEKVMA